MRIEDIVAQARKAREYEFEAGARKYRLRLPSDHEQRVAYINRMALLASEAAAAAAAQRDLLEQALIGWEGVLLTDLVKDAPAPVPVEFAQTLVVTVLDALDNDACAMARDMTERLSKRNEKVEAHAKNS